MPSTKTLVGCVNEKAFAFMVQALPCPTFGQLISGSPRWITVWYFSSCSENSTTPWTPCPTGIRGAVQVPNWAVSGFRFPSRLSTSIHSTLPGQQGITPAFGTGLLVPRHMTRIVIKMDQFEGDFTIMSSLSRRNRFEYSFNPISPVITVTVVT